MIEGGELNMHKCLQQMILEIKRMFNNCFSNHHCTSDMKWMKSRIGEHRLHRISRWKTLLDNGIVIAGGSDCPIEEGNPLHEFYAAITRTDHDGFPKGGWQSQEKLSRIEALNLFTQGAAIAEFSENKRGMIDIGYEADLSILSNDIMSIESEKF